MKKICERLRIIDIMRGRYKCAKCLYPNVKMGRCMNDYFCPYYKSEGI